jgi:hypothetical protein
VLVGAWRWSARPRGRSLRRTRRAGSRLESALGTDCYYGQPQRPQRFSGQGTHRSDRLGDLGSQRSGCTRLLRALRIPCCGSTILIAAVGPELSGQIPRGPPDSRGRLTELSAADRSNEGPSPASPQARSVRGNRIDATGLRRQYVPAFSPEDHFAARTVIDHFHGFHVIARPIADSLGITQGFLLAGCPFDRDS